VLELLARHQDVRLALGLRVLAGILVFFEVIQSANLLLQLQPTAFPYRVEYEQDDGKRDKGNTNLEQPKLDNAEGQEGGNQNEVKEADGDSKKEQE
jgi:hypothetical protein